MQKAAFLFTIIVLTAVIFADVSATLTRQPSVPYFLESHQFKTIEMNLFTSDVSGMLINEYGDLAWNPAFLGRLRNRKIYFDLDFGNSAQSSQPYSYYTSADYRVYPAWFQQTYISGIQTTPLYNLALLLPVSKKLKIGLINRSNFDYGPFRETYYWDYRAIEANSYMDYQAIMNDLEPQRLEVDENQQTVYSLQTDLMLAYQWTDRLHLGLKIGNYLFRLDGELYDSKWGIYPHSEFADLNDETLTISGDQYTLGLGLIFQANEKTSWGAYGELITGQSTEESTSLDTSYSWSERNTDPDYFSFYDYDMTMNQTCDSDANRKTLALSYQKKISNLLTLRSFLKYSSLKSDLGLVSASEDTTFRDRTYDTYDNNSYHFQRQIYHAARRQNFDGKGTKNSDYWHWFIALVYHPEDDWSLFGGLQLTRQHNKTESRDESDYYSASDYTYQYYDPHTLAYLNTHDKYYEYTAESDRFSVHIPLGLKVQVVRGFHLIFAGEMHYYLTDSQKKGRLLYPKIESKKWKNSVLIVDDPELNRYEEYSSQPAKDFSRSSNINIGFAYRHSSGIDLYVRSVGNLLETASWDIGLEYSW